MGKTTVEKMETAMAAATASRLEVAAQEAILRDMSNETRAVIGPIEVQVTTDGKVYLSKSRGDAQFPASLTADQFSTLMAWGRQNVRDEKGEG